MLDIVGRGCVSTGEEVPVRVAGLLTASTGVAMSETPVCPPACWIQQHRYAWGQPAQVVVLNMTGVARPVQVVNEADERGILTPAVRLVVLRCRWAYPETWFMRISRENCELARITPDRMREWSRTWQE